MNWYQSVMKTSPRTTPVSRGNYNLVPRADGVTMSVRAGCGTIYVVSSLFENDDYIQHDESVFNDIGSSIVNHCRVDNAAIHALQIRFLGQHKANKLYPVLASFHICPSLTV